MKRLCFVVSSEMTAKVFLVEQIRALSAHYRVDLVANTSNPGFLRPYGLETEVIPLAIERKVGLVRDLRTLLQLYGTFRGRRFSAVHSITPKAGFLGMVAALFARVPARTHTFTGQVWATRRGPTRFALKSLDRLLALSATNLLADSLSQRDFLIRQGVVREAKIAVLGDGSISGVDISRFKPDPEARALIREDLGISSRGLVFLFLGRLTEDKGVLSLARAFCSLSAAAETGSEFHLLVVGPDEEGMAPRMRASCQSYGDRIHFVGFSETPERHMAAADVFCLPSLREGFGSVIIEAAAVGLPAIASRIYGITDAVVDGETGVLHAAGDVDEIAACMRRLAVDERVRSDLGRAARARAVERFSSQRLTEAVVAYYRQLIGALGEDVGLEENRASR